MAKKRKGALPSGNVRVQVYVGRDEDGRRRYKSFTAPSRQQALEAARLWQVTREEPAPKTAVFTLAQAMDAFIETCRAQEYSPSTVPGYLSIRKHAFQSLLTRRVDQLTASDVQAALDARAVDHSVKTVRNEFYFLRKVLSIHAPKLDLRQIIIAKRKQPKKRTFRQSWAADILDASRPDADFHLYCCLMIFAGLRPSETYALTWADISARPQAAIHGGERYQFGEISVTKADVLDESRTYRRKAPKTDAGERTVTADWSLFQHIYSVRKRGAPGDRIVTLKPNQVVVRWKKLRERLDLPQDFRFYDLRHFFATSMVRAGATEEELQAAMGHSTSAFTHRVYVEMFEESARSVNANMAAMTRTLLR